LIGNLWWLSDNARTAVNERKVPFTKTVDSPADRGSAQPAHNYSCAGVENRSPPS
jgi:hypothetical protein